MIGYLMVLPTGNVNIAEQIDKEHRHEPTEK